MYAGVYAYVCCVLLVQLLRPAADMLAPLVGIQPGYSLLFLGVPAVIIAPFVWWTLVERRGRYIYPVGMTFGLLFVLITLVFWVLVFAGVWGVAVILAGNVVLAFVTVLAVPFGIVAGLPLMYARRRVDDDRITHERAPQ